MTLDILLYNKHQTWQWRMCTSQLISDRPTLETWIFCTSSLDFPFRRHCYSAKCTVCKIFTHNEDIVRLNICESLNMLKISLLYLIKKLLYRYHWFLNSSLKKKWNVRTTITFALISKNINNFHFHFQKCFFACNTAMIQALYLHFWNKDGRGGAYSSNPWRAVFIIYPLECMNC